MKLDKELLKYVHDRSIEVSVLIRKFNISGRRKKETYIKDLDIDAYFIECITVCGIDIFIYMVEDSRYRCKGVKYRDCNSGLILMSKSFISTYRRMEQIEFINYAIFNILTLHKLGSRIMDSIDDSKQLFHFPKIFVPKFTKYINQVKDL